MQAGGNESFGRPLKRFRELTNPRPFFLSLNRTETCRFSGLRIYPGRAVKFVRTDTQIFTFLKSKCRTLFNQRKKPAKLAWTALYRKQHKKDATSEVTKRKKRGGKATLSRAIAGASLEVIQKKRSEKPEVRQAARDAALREVKERMKKVKDTKKAASKGGKKGGKR